MSKRAGTNKDIVELTWKDVKSIVQIADHIIIHETGKYATKQEYYEAILKRYIEEKKKIMICAETT